MIKVNLYYNKHNDLWKLKLYGHAGYAKHGEDIVCAAVSMIVINTINSIESLTDEPLDVSQNPKEGDLSCIFDNIRRNVGSKEAILLLKSMELGLQSVKEEYGDYIEIKIHQGGE